MSTEESRRGLAEANLRNVVQWDFAFYPGIRSPSLRGLMARAKEFPSLLEQAHQNMVDVGLLSLCAEGNYSIDSPEGIKVVPRINGKELFFALGVAARDYLASLVPEAIPGNIAANSRLRKNGDFIVSENPSPEQWRDIRFKLYGEYGLGFPANSRFDPRRIFSQLTRNELVRPHKGGEKWEGLWSVCYCPNDSPHGVFYLNPHFPEGVEHYFTTPEHAESFADSYPAVIQRRDDFLHKVINKPIREKMKVVPAHRVR